MCRLSDPKKWDRFQGNHTSWKVREELPKKRERKEKTLILYINCAHLPSRILNHARVRQRSAKDETTELGVELLQQREHLQFESHQVYCLLKQMKNINILWKNLKENMFTNLHSQCLDKLQLLQKIQRTRKMLTYSLEKRHGHQPQNDPGIGISRQVFLSSYSNCAY